MSPEDTQTPPATDIPVPQLVAQVYESAPPALRSRLLEQLLKPLGILSLVAVANGIFANIRFHSGWPDMHIDRRCPKRTEQRCDALVERVQQVSVESVNGLARMLLDSPVMTSSATAALLVTVLMQRTRTRREGDGDARQQLRSHQAESPTEIYNSTGIALHFPPPMV
jgi:hypothetical protein